MIGLEREELTPAERVGRVLDGERPDRAPYFLNADLHAAALLGVPARELTSSAELATEGALAVQQRLGNDLVTSFIHSAGEAAAFGADVIEFDDGPANADAPPLTPSSLSALRPPPLDHPALALRLDVTRRLAARLEGRVLLLGAVIGPFSLPVMQLGFSTWLDLLHDAPTEAARLLAVNVEHDVAFARAQLAAGAAAILVFEPLASTEIVDPRVHRELGLPALARFGRELGAAFGVSAASAASRATSSAAARRCSARPSPTISSRSTRSSAAARCSSATSTACAWRASRPRTSTPRCARSSPARRRAAGSSSPSTTARSP